MGMARVVGVVVVAGHFSDGQDVGGLTAGRAHTVAGADPDDEPTTEVRGPVGAVADVPAGRDRGQGPTVDAYLTDPRHWGAVGCTRIEPVGAEHAGLGRNVAQAVHPDEVAGRCPTPDAAAADVVVKL